MKIAIIGAGVLGTVQKNWLLKNTEHEVLTYDADQDKSNSTFESLATYATHFILCLPTNSKENGDLDTSILEVTIKNLDKFKTDKKKTIIIRSTVPLYFTRRIAEKYKDFYFYFIPEFLTEKTAQYDFEHPQNFIVGANKPIMTTEYVEHTLEMYEIFPKPKSINCVVFEEAEMLKLVTNSFYAMKIIFANEVAFLCDKFNVSYNHLSKLLSQNPRIGSHPRDNQGMDVHLRVGQDGHVGYGGKCLPKDIGQLVVHMEKNDVGYGLLKKVQEINSKIRKV